MVEAHNNNQNGLATYNLTGGLLIGGDDTAPQLTVAGEEIGCASTGIFNQSGGTNICYGHFQVGGNLSKTLFRRVPAAAVDSTTSAALGY